jgi:GT2 family glycosyltransferase
MPGSGAAIDPAIDIAMVTWNTRDTTLEALAALYAVAPSGTRVLVRDNASSDGTAAAIRAAYPQVDLDEGERNLGFAGGVNTILRRSTAPWVLLLNSDAWPERGALEAMVACAERHPRAAAVAPRLLRPDGSPEVAVWPFPSVRTTIRAGRSSFDSLRDHDKEHTVDWAIGAALLIRRSALEQIGELDESLFMYGEDLDWCWRARDAGWEIWLASDAVVRHVGNASGVQRYGAKQAARWIPNSVVVYRRRRTAVGTWLWQVANASATAGAAVKARRRGDEIRAEQFRLQTKAWLRPRHFADDGDT